MIAQKIFPYKDNPLQSVLKFLDQSEKYLEFGPDHRPRPGHLPPLKTIDKKIEELRKIYNGYNRRTIGQSYYIDYKISPIDLNQRPVQR